MALAILQSSQPVPVFASRFGFTRGTLPDTWPAIAEQRRTDSQVCRTGFDRGLEIAAHAGRDHRGGRTDLAHRGRGRPPSSAWHWPSFSPPSLYPSSPAVSASRVGHYRTRGPRSPSNAVPIRRCVAPASTAASRSPLMPAEITVAAGRISRTAAEVDRHLPHGTGHPSVLPACTRLRQPFRLHAWDITGHVARDRRATPYRFAGVSHRLRPRPRDRRSCRPRSPWRPDGSRAPRP